MYEDNDEPGGPEMEDETPRSLVHVPDSSEELNPLRTADLITEATHFMRTHWDDIKVFWKAIGGEGDSPTGSRVGDMWQMTFEIQKVAATNGYATLATVNANDLRKALRRGYKRLTGDSVIALEKQGIRLRIGFRR